MNYIIFVLLAIYLAFMLFLRKRRPKKTEWDPFELAKMMTIIERDNGSTFERPFKRFEYVNQKIDDGTIIGIYLTKTKPKTKRQIKYEKLCEKWR